MWEFVTPFRAATSLNLLCLSLTVSSAPPGQLCCLAKEHNQNGSAPLDSSNNKIVL